MLNSPPPLCQYLVGGQDRCHAPATRGHVCKVHKPAYDESYNKYKDAGNDARALSACARLKRSEVGQLARAEVDVRIVDIGAYMEALEREKALRKEHDRTFVGQPDSGHRARIEKIEQQLEHSRDILHMLRSRRGRLQRRSREQPQRARASTLPGKPTPLEQPSQPKRATLPERPTLPTLPERPAVAERSTLPERPTPAARPTSPSRSDLSGNCRKADEERRAQATVEAREDLSQEHERQHSVQAQANRTRDLEEEDLVQRHIRTALTTSEVESQAFHSDDALPDVFPGDPVGTRSEEVDVLDAVVVLDTVADRSGIEEEDAHESEDEGEGEGEVHEALEVEIEEDVKEEHVLSQTPRLPDLPCSEGPGQPPPDDEYDEWQVPVVSGPVNLIHAYYSTMSRVSKARASHFGGIRATTEDRDTADDEDSEVGAGIGASKDSVPKTITTGSATMAAPPDSVDASVSQGSESRTGNSDLERQETGSEDASRPRRRPRWRVLWRIVYLVLALIAGVLPRTEAMSKSWRLVRGLRARAAGGTLVLPLYGLLSID